MTGKLQKEYQKIQDRIDAMYVDKLDGKIAQEFFDRKNSDWCAEQAEILREIEKHQNANFSYLEEDVLLLELAQKAVSLYEKQEMKEKRRILDFLFSNCLWKGGSLVPNYRKPFDTLALTNAAYQCERRSSSNGPAFCRCAFQSASFGRKISFHARSAPGIIERSRWSLLRQLAQHGLRYFLRFVS